MLAIEVTLLTGRYVATAYNSRRDPEWPPHPARLFSALVATHFSDEQPAIRTDERAVLEWLEQQGAPAIVASDATPRELVTVFVPVNDVALTDVDREASRFDEARAALTQADQADRRAAAKCSTEVRKAEEALSKAIRTATAVPARPPHPNYGRRVLPEFRGRQPRTFPSVTPADPHVTYVWTDAAATDAQRGTLSGLLRRVVRLGHSSTLVSLRIVDRPSAPTWRPDDDGEASFRVVRQGQLQLLEHAFAQHRETEPRVMPARPQPYTRHRRRESIPPPTSTFSDQWLVLRRVEGPVLPMTATAGLARAVRRALMSYADEPIAEGLSGHTAGGHASVQAHLAVVPLAFVGHQYATGAMLGVALILPRDASPDTRRAVYVALHRWEERYRLEDEDTPVFPLTLGEAGVLRLERVEWGSVPATLRPSTWSGPSARWLSATPVALDRHPGDLQSRDPHKQARAVEEAVTTISQSCQRIGLTRPARVEVLPAAPLAGAAKARHYPPFPAESNRTRRVLTHVLIEFDEPVAGPILLGAGRHVGLGLMRPVEVHGG
jgi:CRISPR-associated protein Csb2